MPYMTTTTEVPAELFYEWDGVKVYHSYKYDEMNEGPSIYWYVLDPFQSTYEAFDVRDLPGWTGGDHLFPTDWTKKYDRIREVMKDAIVNGVLTVDGVKKENHA